MKTIEQIRELAEILEEHEVDQEIEEQKLFTVGEVRVLLREIKRLRHDNKQFKCDHKETFEPFETNARKFCVNCAKEVTP